MTRKERGFDLIGFALNAWLVLIGLFVLAPLFFVVVNSFNASSISIFPPAGFSLRWYKMTLFDTSPYSPAPQFRKGFRNSIVIASGATVLALLAGILASLAFVRHRFSGKEALRSFFLSPLIVPRVVFGTALFLLYIRIGLYGTISGVMIAHALLGLPYVLSIITANLLSIDFTTEEAAMDLGANRVQAFLLVTLPQMRVGLIVAMLFAFITSFDQVD
ncbi:MAG: ABC transporter permease, partial [bacterium]